MNLLDAAYHTVHDYPGGATALAPRIGIKSHAVLNSKVNPNTETHHLTLLETSKLIGITGDYRILQSLCAENGKVAIDLPDIPECKDIELTHQVLNIGINSGNIYQIFQNMMADGRITRGEALDISKVIQQLQINLATLDAQIHKCIDEK